MADYKKGNYEFVIGNSFNPMSLQERLAPLMVYKDAYEKRRTELNDIADKTAAFKYLSEELPQGSKAKQIFDNYYNDFKPQADSFSNEGLTLSNASALDSLRKRFAGEIGRLAEADKMFKKAQELRLEAYNKGIPMIYAKDNLTIDDVLDGRTKSLYGISSNDLASRGAALGKAISARMVTFSEDSAMDDYYKNVIQTIGINQDNIETFMNLPEIRKRIASILKETGVVDNMDPNSASYKRAESALLNGVYEGIVYQESRTPHQNLGKLTAAQVDQAARSDKQLTLSGAGSGLVYDEDLKTWKYVPGIAPDEARDKWMYDIDPVTGQRTGYSKKYMGYQNAKNSSESSSKSTDKNTVTKKDGTKHRLRSAQQVDKDGGYTEYSKEIKAGSSGRSKGKQMSYEDAVAINPHIKDFDSGFENYYYYYVKDDKSVYIEPKDTDVEVNPEDDGQKTPKTEQLTPQAPKTSTEETDNNNTDI